MALALSKPFAKQAVETVLLGMLDQYGNLDSQVVPDRPHEQQMMDMPAILQAHLSHRDNQDILQELQATASRSGSAAARLLRLLAAPLFDSSRYTQIRHIGKGAYANVSSSAYSLPSARWRCAWCIQCLTRHNPILGMKVRRALLSAGLCPCGFKSSAVHDLEDAHSISITIKCGRLGVQMPETFR